MDNIESQSSSGQSVDPAECEYQENQVVWGKVHGYPWWPGFEKLTKITSPIPYTLSTFLETILSIVFFYSLLSLRTNSQKIRKFQSHFHFYAQNARKNYKLKQSLISAQEQLQQNNEDVGYFSAVKRSKRGRKPGSRIVDRVPSEMAGSQQNQIGSEVVVKRGRGRPRKIQIVTEPLEQSLRSSPTINLPKRRFSPIKRIQTPSSEQIKKISIKQSPKITSKLVQQHESLQPQLKQLKQYIKTQHYKQIATFLLRGEINGDNILQILDLKVMELLNNNIGNRQLTKIRQMLKKILLAKYFPFEENNLINLQSVSYGSVRGKIIRKLRKLFRRLMEELSENIDVSSEARRLSTECEKAVRMRHRNGLSYMREMRTIFAQTEVLLTLPQNRDLTLQQLQQRIINHNDH